MSSTQVDARVDAAGAGPSGPTAWARNGHRWWVLAVIGLAYLMVVLDGTIVSIALPSAQKALHFDNDGRQWIVVGRVLCLRRDPHRPALPPQRRAAGRGGGRRRLA